MLEIELVTKLLREKQPLVALVAPSFPVMYPSAIVGKIRRLGFGAIIEVSAGAAKTNEALIAAFKNNSHARYITSPCPSFVRMVRKKYPKLMEFVTTSIDSPMAASARLAKEKYPGYRPVFIGPCFAKKMESREDCADLGIVVITFVELESLFKAFNIRDGEGDGSSTFDVAEKHTRLYPTDGGLTDSSGIRSLLTEDEIRVVSGWKNCEPALAEFATNPSIRLLDILFCDGGCINGPGIVSPLSTAERKNKVATYYTSHP